jgi:tetratricopeptide (TPR) repeat protein
MERLIVWHRWCPPPEPSPEAAAQANLWRIQARERLSGLGAEIVAELGGTIVAALAPEAVEPVLEACLSLSREVEEEEGLEVGSVAYAITTGPLDRSHAQGPLVGDALDRAQALASYAAAGDVVMDQRACSMLATKYLFAGELRAGVSISGVLLDRSYPHRARCADALARLSPPSMPATAQVQFESFRRLAGGTGRQRVILMAPYGSGASAWLSRVAAELKPSTWLCVRALGAGFAPLSGLRYALLRLTGATSIEQVLGAKEEPDRQALTTLSAVRAGRVVLRRDAIMALRQYVGRSWEQTGRRPLITVNPTALIDAATLGVVAEVARDGGPDCLVVMRLLPDGKPPEAFARGAGLAELRVPALSQSEARSLALSMLGKSTPPDLARRAATMGGSSPLGVAEAVRVLVSSGDIVPDESGFRWRRGPTGRASALGIHALLEERLDQLREETRRVLQVLAWVPDPGERALLEEVALLDGIAGPALDAALDELSAKFLIDRQGDDLVLSHSVRNVVLADMSPARGTNLSLRVAGALTKRCPDQALFARADIAFYLARGGRAQSAVDALLEAAMAAGKHGFVRSGVRLSAAAVECSPSPETRKKAAKIAESLGRAVVAPPPPAADAASVPATRDERREMGLAAETMAEAARAAPSGGAFPAELASEAMKQAISAIRAQDYENVERALELLVASGQDGPHVDRIRAMAQLERGDRSAAANLLARAKARAAGEREAPRTTLSRALLLFSSADHEAAVRETLRAVAETRLAGDRAGESASLLTLAAFYRQLGRVGESVQLEQAATNAAPQVTVAAPAARGDVALGPTGSSGQ